MSSNNNIPHRTSPRFSSSTNHNTNGGNTPTRATSKRNKIYSSSSLDSNCVTSAAAILSQGDSGTLNPNKMQIYLQKLDLLYQSLERRVLKLEQIFSGDLTIPYSNNTTNTANNSNHYNTIISTIDNNAGNFEFNPSTIVPSSIGSTSSSSTLCSLLEPIHKEISVI